MKATVKERIRILDFDIEARPLSYLGSDFTTREITAIAWCWVGEGSEPEVRAIPEVSIIKMLGDFLKVYNQAGMVTGHYVRGYDLPTINGALLELGEAPLQSKLAHDTSIDLIKRSGISGSQENLGAMLGLDAPKIGMNQHKWRTANRLTKEGIALTKERVVGDVIQHMELRAALLAQGSLGPPRMWTSSPTPYASYTP